jgi:hypothetical protein
MDEDQRKNALDRLERFAYSYASSYFADLYAYGMPSGEQAQMDVEAGEAIAEDIMASQETARRWIVDTDLYGALAGSGRRDPDEELDRELEGLTGPSLPPEERASKLMEIHMLDRQIEHLEETLRYLRDRREQLR